MNDVKLTKTVLVFISTDPKKTTLQLDPSKPRIYRVRCENWPFFLKIIIIIMFFDVSPAQLPTQQQISLIQTNKLTK